MAKTETKTPAVQKKGGAVAELPAYMRGKSGQGTEGVSSADVALPLIKLAQAISPELETIDGLKAGQFFHTITEEILGEEFEMIMVYCDIRAMLFRPRETGGGVLARSDNMQTWTPSNAVFDVQLKSKKMVKWSTKGSVAESGLLEFGSGDPDDPQSQPAGTRMYNIVAMLPDFEHLSPSIITCQRSSIKPAKNFLGKLKMSRAPSYGLKFRCQSTDEQGASGPYKGIRFVADGFVNEDDFKLYEEFYKKFSSEGIKIREADLEGASHDAAAAGGESTTQAPADRPKY